MDPEPLRELQIAQLRRYLRNKVLPFSKRYGGIFSEAGLEADQIRTWNDLARIPFTSKRDLLNTPEHPERTRDFVLIPDPDELSRRPSTILRALVRGRRRVKADLESEFKPILMTSTTGRSSEPVPFLYTQHDLDNLAITGRRLMEVCESQSSFRHLNMFPFAPHLAFWQAHYAGLGFNVFCLSTGGGKVMGTSGNVSLLAKIKPEALIGMPTFIYHVLGEALAQGVRCESLKRFVLGGEKVPAGMRRKLRAMAAELGSPDVDVMATYAFTEAKMAWPECPVRGPDGAEPSGYHLYPDLGITEIIDPDSGEAVGEGEPGEIVFTPLDARGSVVLRYRTGDIIGGGLVYEPCPHCGRRVPRLIGRISRVSDIRRLNIGKVKGTLVNFNDLEHILDDIDGIGAWQIEIRKQNDDPMEPDEIVVHVQRHGDHRDEKGLSAEITRSFRVQAELSPNRIEYHEAAKMREMHGVGKSLKEDKVVDHRPKRGEPDTASGNADAGAQPPETAPPAPEESGS